jgi:hypothetical protein
MSWLQKLQDRWKVQSLWHVVLILLVFACTGTTVVYIAKPILQWIFGAGEIPVWAKIIYYIVILPVYNIFLLAYGLLFGQFKFFYEFEKRLFDRLKSKFKKS